MKTLPLTNSKELVLIDDCDFEILSQATLRIGNCGYVRAYFKKSVVKKYGIKDKYIYIHRFIMDTPKGMDTDHRDLNKLNCQRYNLRICTHSQNTCNRIKRNHAKTSKYTGVYFYKRGNCFMTSIIIDGKKKHFRCNSEVDAAQKYNELAKKYYGEFARLNEI